jgi:hypothetical protein
MIAFNLLFLFDAPQQSKILALKKCSERKSVGTSQTDKQDGKLPRIFKNCAHI